ncbi:MAG TPA: LCP family protein [Intrasporangiaceae bacterium]|nr:LCP family protein [Intrasporangiaceae bacterium]
MSPAHHDGHDDARAIPIGRRGGERGKPRDVERTRVIPVQQSAPPPPPPPPPAARAPRPHTAHREPPPRRPARRRGGLGRVLAFAIVAWLVFLVAAPLIAWFRLERLDTTPENRVAASGGSTYLLVGYDGNVELSPQEREAGGRRTDSIILVHDPVGDGPRALISIPRDSYLEIPGHGANKVNAAFAFGGPQLLVETLEQRTGLRIDGYAEIGFFGFRDVVDSLGGVRICVPFDMDDPRAHINLKEGCQVLDGATSLGYVRARYSDPRGDLGRAERQRQFLGAIMDRAATPATVLVPWRWWGFTQSAAKGVAVGEDTSVFDMAQILLTMRGVSGGGTVSLQVPVANMNYQTSAGSSVQWDDAAADRLFQQIRDGVPLVAP